MMNASTTTIALPLLDTIRIASQCPMKWEEMRTADDEGGERRRFCDHCSLHVHNIAGLTRSEAERMLHEAAGGRLCVRLFRRTDGTILTRDCPVGRAALHRRAMARVVRGIGFVACCLAAGLAWATSGGQGFSRARLRTMQPFESVAAWIHGRPPQVLMPPIAGDVCMPAPAVNTGSTGGTINGGDQ
jgi:hypothetical protein